MGTLYIDRKDIELRHEGRHVCLYEGGERRGTVPLNVIERVVIRGRAVLSTGVLGLLQDAGVGLLILSGRRSRPLALLAAGGHGDTRRRIGQYRWYFEPTEQLVWATRLVRLKVLAQLRALSRARSARPDLETNFNHGLSALRRALDELEGLAQRSATVSLTRLNGIEGAAAAAYFGAYGALFPASLGFTGRNRRPPKDPVNAVLSLSYTLLHFDAVGACRIAGLDPDVGFYHAPAYSRESLAADLIEPLRARVDLWVWRLFADRVLRADSFAEEQNGCRLGKAGRQRFYACYETFAKGPRRLLRRYALGVARRLLETSP